MIYTAGYDKALLYYMAFKAFRPSIHTYPSPMYVHEDKVSVEYFLFIMAAIMINDFLFLLFGVFYDLLLYFLLVELAGL